jgi:putative endopeptidase
MDLCRRSTAWIVTTNTAFPKIAKIYADTPIDTLKAWQAFKVADGAAPMLSKRFVDAASSSATRPWPASPSRSPAGSAASPWSTAAGRGGRPRLCRRLLPAGLQGQDGRPGRRHPHRLKARIEPGLDEPETKAKAQDKLAKFTVKIGYPTSGATMPWRSRPATSTATPCARRLRLATITTSSA